MKWNRSGVLHTNGSICVARALKTGRVCRWRWEVGNQAGESSQKRALCSWRQRCVQGAGESRNEWVVSAEDYLSNRTC